MKNRVTTIEKSPVKYALYATLEGEPVTYWWYEARDENGDAVRVLVGSDGRITVWGSFGHFATHWEAPGPCIRTFLCESSPGYLLDRLAPESVSKRDRRAECKAMLWVFAKHIVPMMREHVAQVGS